MTDQETGAVDVGMGIGAGVDVDVYVIVGPRGATDAADRAFLLAAAGWALGSAPGELSLEHHCPTCGGRDHGQPNIHRTDGAAGTGQRLNITLDVSLSRAGTSVAIALSFAGPVGIDIESVDLVARAGFDDVAFNPVELAALDEVPAGGDAWARAAIWTGKEAALKAVGVGLRVDPRTLTVRLLRWGQEGHPTLGAEPQPALPQILPRLAGFDAGPGLVGTVAVFSIAAPVVRVLPAGRIRRLPVT